MRFTAGPIPFRMPSRCCRSRGCAKRRSRGNGRSGPRRGGVGVMEMEAQDAPENELALEFAPGPDGLDTKRVVMPRLQRTDLLRPPIGGGASGSKLVEPEHDRFRTYLGSAGLKRVREARQDRGSHRIRAVFMIVMVLTLGFILLKMVT